MFASKVASQQTTEAAPRNVQRKLAIGRTDDPLEHEADRVADQIMRMPDPALPSRSSPLQISRKCTACEEEDKHKEPLQMKPAAAPRPQSGEAPGIVHDVLQSPGQPLDAATRAFFEPRLGRDLSKVRIHADTQAAKSAQEVKSLAYTVGRKIVFAEQRYAPTTSVGRRLLAHELAHVLQQEALPGTPAADGTVFAARPSAVTCAGSADGKLRRQQPVPVPPPAQDAGPNEPSSAMARESIQLPPGLVVQLTNPFTTPFGLGHPTNTGNCPITINNIDNTGKPFPQGQGNVLILQPGGASDHYGGAPGAVAIGAASTADCAGGGEITIDMPVS